ncbi:hypothetical protein BS47DRAFT_1264767, partial [Hydnum rufescens UP504]
FFEMRMNVCALKRRLRDKLWERRFEEGRLRADYRPFVTGKYYVCAQITRATERRGGVFKRLANKINALINDMTVLKKSRAAPGMATLPSLIDVSNIWDMADPALYEDWDMVQDEDTAPAWLCDEETRRGIVAMLEKARCKEEKRRL